MSIFSNKSHLIPAYLCIVIICFLCCLLFSAVYTLVPLTLQIIPFFANLSLGLAVFCGSFYLAQHTPFFRIRNILRLTFLVLLTIILSSLISGELSLGIIAKKGLWVILCSTLGEFSGHLSL